MKTHTCCQHISVKAVWTCLPRKLKKKIGKNFSLETANPSPPAMRPNDEWKEFLLEVISNDPIYWDNWKDFKETEIIGG